MAVFARTMAQRVADLELSDLEPEAIALIKLGLVDCIGVALAAFEEPLVGIVRDSFFEIDGGKRESTLFADGGLASSPQAALLNTAAAHALDFDDTSFDAHPSAVLFPSILAEAERLGSSGRDVLVAYAAAFDVWARLHYAELESIHTKGWHPSSTLGTVAAAAGAAKIAGLSAEQTVNALAIAASMSAGVVANFGSMMKPVQVGLASSNGVRAARLSAAGLKASEDAIEHPKGLLSAISQNGHIDLSAATSRLRSDSSTLFQLGLNIKQYPVCYAMHRAIDAMRQVCLECHISASQISRIEAHIGVDQAAMLRTAKPTDALSAKFSLPFALACMGSKGHLTLEDLKEDRILDPDVYALMDVVEIITHDERDPDEPLFSPTDWVVVTLDHGRREVSHPVSRPEGHARRPISMNSLEQKFDSCSRGAIPNDQSRGRLFNHLIRLEETSSIKDLTKELGCSVK